MAGEDDREGAGFYSFGIGCAGGRSVCESFEGGLDGGEVIEGVETIGAAAELSGGLRTAEHQEAKNGGFVAAQVEYGADAVFVLGDA